MNWPSMGNFCARNVTFILDLSIKETTVDNRTGVGGRYEARQDKGQGT